MTTMIWSSDQIQTEFSDCKNLGDVIQSVENKMWSQGEVVCEIFVNGLALQEEDEARLSASNLSDIRELKVQSNRPDELVQKTLQSITQYLPDLLEETDSLAAKYREIEAQEVGPLLSEVLEGFRWLTDAVFLIRSQLALWPEVEEVLEDWKELEDKHSKALRELISSLEGNDQILVADVLEYDVADILEDWRRIIPQVLSALKGDKIAPECLSESSS